MNDEQTMQGYEEEDKGVVHWAGEPVCICGRVIQRCKVCGEKLLDNLGPTDWAIFQMDSGGQIGKAFAIQTWALGAWIFHKNGEFKVVNYPVGYYPENGCVSLVERDTICLPES